MYGDEGNSGPCLRDDDVVEWLVALAEAGETDLYDHYAWRGTGRLWCSLI